MSNEKSDAKDNVRQHVRKVMAQLRALKEQQREKPGPEEAVEGASPAYRVLAAFAGLPVFGADFGDFEDEAEDDEEVPP